MVLAAEAAETEAWHHFRGGKFTAQWYPVCRWSSHFPGEFHASCLCCIDFHAWNCLILKDNIMDAIWCKEWPIFNTGSLVGYSETARSRRLRHSVSLHDSHLLPALLSQCQMVERTFSQSDMASLFLYGAAVTLPWAPISGDSRKVDGAGDSGMGSLFFSESGTFSSRPRRDCIVAWLHKQGSYPDQYQLSGAESGALETS